MSRPNYLKTDEPIFSSSRGEKNLTKPIVCFVSLALGLTFSVQNLNFREYLDDENVPSQNRASLETSIQENSPVISSVSKHKIVVPKEINNSSCIIIEEKDTSNCLEYKVLGNGDFVKIGQDMVLPTQSYLDPREDSFIFRGDIENKSALGRLYQNMYMDKNTSSENRIIAKAGMDYLDKL